MLSRHVVTSAFRLRALVRATRLRALLLATLVAVSACLAPTLPVPPPSQPEVSAPDASGDVLVQGGKGAVSGGAEVTVENYTLSQSAACRSDPSCYFTVSKIANDDGSYAVKIRGRSGDLLYVWQTVGTQTSGEVQRKVP